MKKHLTAILLLLASIGFAFAGGPAIPPSASSVSGLGTIATVDSPVPVANGGTGATTAATGLAALGGAPLNPYAYSAGFRWVAAPGETVQVATFTVPAYAGCKFVITAGGVEDNVGDGVIERSVKASRITTDVTLDPASVVWGTTNLTAKLTQDSAAGVVRVYLTGGANTIDLRGSLEVRGYFTSPSVWSYTP